MSTLLRRILHKSWPGRACAALSPALRRVVPSSSSSTHYHYSTPSRLLFPASASAAASASASTSVPPTPNPRSLPDNRGLRPVYIHPDPRPHQSCSPSPSCPHRSPQQLLHSAFLSGSSATSQPATSDSHAPRPFTELALNLISSAPLLLSFLPHILASPLPTWPMASASYPYSSSSSDISTPRSSSPSPSTGRSTHTGHTSISKRISISARRTSNWNPMSTIDIKALEEAMKAQQLDQLRGYRQDTYGEVNQAREPVYVTEVTKAQATGHQVLSEPTFNKGNSIQKPYSDCHPRPVLMLILRRRSCFHARRACQQEPDWSVASHPGGLAEAMPTLPAYDSFPSDRR